jgi:hypothetical protein
LISWPAPEIENQLTWRARDLAQHRCPVSPLKLPLVLVHEAHDDRRGSPIGFSFLWTKSEPEAHRSALSSTWGCERANLLEHAVLQLFIVCVEPWTLALSTAPSALIREAIVTVPLSSGMLSKLHDDVNGVLAPVTQ